MIISQIIIISMYYNGKKEMYPGIGRIEFEGVKSKNSLAFRWYNPDLDTGTLSAVMDQIRLETGYCA